MSTLLNFTPQAPSSTHPSPDPKSIYYALQTSWAPAFTPHSATVPHHNTDTETWMGKAEFQ